MKLHLLQIQAFGPFANKETIDFSALGNNPLFLIDGPTGAGKSSILHAICYALYGETTDSDRKEHGLRCDHAAPDLLTQLSLEFSIREDRYRISRVPTQMRPAKRGDGETEQKATAHLCRILADDEQQTLVARKKKDADIKIKQIVGLTAEQFLQVMVLPQGKFRELLLAKSDDRQVILSTLFQTEIYKRIEQLLKDRAGAIEKQNQSFEDRKTEALSDVGVVDIEALELAEKQAFDVFNTTQQEKQQAAEKKQHAAITLETAVSLTKLFDSRHSKQKALDDCLQQLDEINAIKLQIVRAEKAALISPKWQALESLEKDIHDKSAGIDNAKISEDEADLLLVNTNQQLEQAVEAYTHRDLLKSDEAQFIDYQQKLATFQALKDAANAADKKYRVAIDNKTTLEEQARILEQAVINLNDQITSLEIVIANKPDIVEHKLMAKGRYDKRLDLENAVIELQELNKRHQKAEHKYNSAEVVYKEAEKVANQIEMQWFSSQAAVLAAKLEIDQPCVVCGSLDHPNPASFSQDLIAINQQAVDQARELQSKKSKIVNTCKESLLASLHGVKDKESKVNELTVELADDAIKAVLELEQNHKALDKDLTAIVDKEKQLLQAKKLKLDKENERVSIASKIQIFNEKVSELTAAKASAETELKSVENILPEQYRVSTVIEKTLQQVQQKIKKLENSHDKANKDHTDALKNHSSIVAKLKTLRHMRLKSGHLVQTPLLLVTGALI